jgi:DNA-directed RNA polymerase specialized sigma subunit
MEVGGKAMLSKKNRALIIRAAELVDQHRNGVPRTEFRRLVFQQQIEVPNEVREAIWAVNAIESEVIDGYHRIVRKIAHKWMDREFSIYIGVEDVVQGGILALLDCMYAYKGFYKGKSVKFITYVGNVVERRLLEMVNATLTKHLRRSRTALELVEAFEKVKKLGQISTFDAICDHLKFSNNERMRLERALVCVLQQDESSDLNDLADTKQNLQSQGNDTLEQVSGIWDQLSGIWDQLNEFEQAVITAASSGEWGWQEKVAGQFVNPNTGKRYTRQAPHVVMKKIQKMLKVA